MNELSSKRMRNNHLCASTPGKVPEVTGPIPATKTDHPFLASKYQNIPQNLSVVGYLEEE
ncbi:hypothetical protein ACFL7M_16970 [Thermodesulfobacteriota bacterium]